MVHPSLDAWAARPWTEAPLVALDLEGTGSQDGADEAILEIAAIRLVDGRPDVDNAYTTLLNPGRPVPTRPWISPGLTTATVAAAPILADVEPHLSIRLNGRLLVGHNVGVDWRLLHRHCPSITPVGLLDTYKLARQVTTSGSRALATLLDALDLTERVHAAAPGGRPHRALWDTAGAALLLAALVERHWSSPPTVTALIAICGQPLEPGPAESAGKPSEPTLF